MARRKLDLQSIQRLDTRSSHVSSSTALLDRTTISPCSNWYFDLTQVTVTEYRPARKGVKFTRCHHLKQQIEKSSNVAQGLTPLVGSNAAH